MNPEHPDGERIDPLTGEPFDDESEDEDLTPD